MSNAKPSPLTIKDEMVRREVDWLRRVGKEPDAAAADRYAVARLERAAAKNAESRLRALARHQKKERKAGISPAERAAARGGYAFRKKPAQDAVDAPKFVSVCSCGGCIQCRREQRVRDVMRLGGAGDEEMKKLAWSLVLIAMRSKAQTGEYAIVRPGQDRARVLTREIEDVIDKSIPVLGGWR